MGILKCAGIIPRLEHLWNEEVNSSASPSLFKVVCKFMQLRLLIACAIFLCCLIFGFIGPTCLVRGLVSFAEKPPAVDGQLDYSSGFYLVLGILLVSFVVFCTLIWV